MGLYNFGRCIPISILFKPHKIQCFNVSKCLMCNLTYRQQQFTDVTDVKHQLQNENRFLVQMKNDPDNFGNRLEQTIIEEADKEQRFSEEQFSPTQKLRTKQYADLIKSYLAKRKIKEAIDVLEIKMLKEDLVKPENYIYNLLLGGCGKVGYTKKAFSLYNQMKKRGLKATGGTYTALFNSCANSPWQEDGLQRAKHLQQIMIEKMYEPNITSYNAMIKAFGRCGDLATAFALVDELCEKKINFKSDTINFLLQACIQDQEAGFRHALLVWRKMLQRNIKPTGFTYNLMLRCIRDCGIGNIKAMQDTVNVLLDSNKKLDSTPGKLLISQSDGGKLIQCVDINDEKNKNDPIDVCRPNLLAKVPTMGNIVSFSEITKAEDRLLFVGGFKKFVNEMVGNGCSPDVKTFTQLLDCLPSLATEKELQKLMLKHNVKPDIDFFNMLIKRRSMRFEYQEAKEVLNEMEKYNYRPDLITFGVLSLGCKNKHEALELVYELRSSAYTLNKEILGSMLHQACSHKNFPYVLEIMEITLKENVEVDEKFLSMLKEFRKQCMEISKDTNNEMSHKTVFQKGFQIFRMRYKTWLSEVKVEDQVHPWTQFRQPTTTDTKHYKDKSSKFKPQHISRFRVKTTNKERMCHNETLICHKSQFR